MYKISNKNVTYGKKKLGQHNGWERAKRCKINSIVIR